MRRGKTVTILGGSAPREGDPAFQQAEELGRGLAQAGFNVATGGYIGLMTAVSKGAAEAHGKVVGVTCERIEQWRGVVPNPWVQDEIRCQSLHERMLRLLELGDAIIALPGGVGTLSEVSLAWSLMQTGEMAPRPVFLVGEGWRSMFEAFALAAADYLSASDSARLTFVPDGQQALHAVTGYFCEQSPVES